MIKIKIVSEKSYQEVLKKYNCYRKNQRINYYNSTNKDENDLFKELLNISEYKCFYCGEDLKSNNEKGIYFEKEHIVDKGIFNKDSREYELLKKCRYNLIPICKNCNSIKYLNNAFYIKILIPETCVDCTEEKECINPSQIVDKYNFNIFKELNFDFLHKIYIDEDQRKINGLKLNERTRHLYDTLFSLIYDWTIDSKDDNYLEIYLKNTSSHIITDKFIEFIIKNNLINTNHLKKLIETIILLDIDEYLSNT